jgi:phenylacetate-CoA ligase
MWLDTAYIKPENILRFNRRLKSFRPKVIVAYARSAAWVARFLQEQQVEVYSPQSIITSAEMLTREDRSVIENVFGCPVFNRYGCREVGVIASECEQHDGLHLMAESLVIEVVAAGNQPVMGQMGRILVTDLFNDAMPLVRYEIGDMASMMESACVCGRGLPRLSGIEGRVTDFVVGSDGRLVSGVFLATYVVARRPSLGQVQIRQSKPGEMVYRITLPDDEPAGADDLEFLETATKKYLGTDTEIRFEFVETLDATPTGKLLFCHSTAAGVSHA